MTDQQDPLLAELLKKAKTIGPDTRGINDESAWKKSVMPLPPGVGTVSPAVARISDRTVDALNKLPAVLTPGYTPDMGPLPIIKELAKWYGSGVLRDSAKSTYDKLKEIQEACIKL